MIGGFAWELGEGSSLESIPQSRIDIYLVPRASLRTLFPHLPLSKLKKKPNTRSTRSNPLNSYHIIIMSSASSRSSSISSISTSSSKYSDIKKKFCCTHPQCGKSFSRSEHLHRHALNHKEGNNTCLRCSAHFRRRDLLGKPSFTRPGMNHVNKASR